VRIVHVRLATVMIQPSMVMVFGAPGRLSAASYVLKSRRTALDTRWCHSKADALRTPGRDMTPASDAMIKPQKACLLRRTGWKVGCIARPPQARQPDGALSLFNIHS